MHFRFSAVICKEKKWYVARCPEVGVTSQGKTIEEARKNLKEAVELYIESFGFQGIPKSLEDPVLTSLDITVNA